MAQLSSRSRVEAERLQACAQVLHEQHKLVWLERRRFKPKMRVEGSGFVIDGMNQDGAGAKLC